MIPHEKRVELLRAMSAIQKSLDDLKTTVMRSCETCDHWEGGCTLADGRVPPASVLAVGCESWREGVPF